MEQKVHALAYARGVEAEYLQEMGEIEAELAATPLGLRLARIQELLRVAREDVADAEDNVRYAALRLYHDTGNKAPHPAVKVVMSTVLDYDPVAAMAYCREHYPPALKLDKSAFEKAAKVLKLDFVDIGTVPTTRISRDLSAYLKEDTNA